MRLPRRLRLLAMTSKNGCHCEASKKPWQSVPSAGTSTPPCSYRYARGRRRSLRKMTASRKTDCHVALLLAMTEKIEARAQIIDYICNCEAPKGPWQSVLMAAGSLSQLPAQRRIATSASPPRNDTVGGRIATGLTALAMTPLGGGTSGLVVATPR